MTKTLRTHLAVAALLLSPMAANADLIGTEVGCEITPTPFWVCDAATNTVGPGAEFELELPQSPDNFGLSVDISSNSITIANIENNAFGLGANELLTLTFVGDVLGVSNFVASNVSDISIAAISFVDNALTIDINSGATWSVGGFVSFDLDVAVDVPEAGTFALLSLGLLGMGLSRRRKKA